MPLKIAIDARKLHDFGIGTYIRNLLHGLGRIDRENQYVVLLPEAEWRLDVPENFAFVVDRSPGYSIRELLSLSWRLNRIRPDVFHATHYVLPAAVRCPVVVTIHDVIHLLYPDFLPNRLALFYAQRMIRRSLTHSARVVAVSKNTKNDLLEYFDVASDKIDVIYNGVSDLFRSRLEESVLAQQLAALQLERPYLLFVGNPTKPHKNLDRVVQAYARAQKIAPFDAPLVCVGARPGSDFKLRQRARALAIEDRLVMLGRVDEAVLPAIYQGATLFLYPTLYEGFGLPVVEAMASGVPVITSNNSALREISEGYAHLVPPLDIDEMARAIAYCMSHPEHRAGLAKLGLRRAQDFDWGRCAERTLDVYRGAAELRHRENT